MKQLPIKWQEHIRKMTEFAQKSNQMRYELEQYLIKQGLTDESFESGCMFEDSIIDVTTQSYEWEDLIKDINLALNGKFEQYIEDEMNKRIIAYRARNVDKSGDNK
ncbi:hypothetical protein ACFQZE_06675 [Paenibacillus sp. GCM10027627]|uniref:hypothetical protein n=1 Tax=unclassified Paenibacillus TaxID=185978 RepID=UPI00363565A0